MTTKVTFAELPAIAQEAFRGHEDKPMFRYTQDMQGNKPIGDMRGRVFRWLDLADQETATFTYSELLFVTDAPSEEFLKFVHTSRVGDSFTNEANQRTTRIK